MSKPIRSVVLGVAALTGDEPWSHPGRVDPALASAAALARAQGAVLHLVHAFELPAPALAGVTLPVSDAARRQYAQHIEARLSAQAAEWVGLEMHTHVVEDSPATAICAVAAAERADLIVVGATRRGRAWRSLIGSTADGVIRAATVPVLVLHQPLQLPIRRVLLTTDLSQHSEALLAGGLATLWALTVRCPDVRLLLVVSCDPLAPPPVAEELAMRGAEPVLRRLGARLGGGVQPRVRAGEVSLEIVREAAEWGADLLVLGTHGRSGFRQHWLGGAALSALRGATCNVLMVPGPAQGKIPRAVPAEADEVEWEALACVC